MPETTIKVGHPELCPLCDATVAYAKTRKGKKILLDFYPSGQGRYVIVVSGSPNVVAQFERTQLPEPTIERFSCHWDTCVAARRPKGRTLKGRGLGIAGPLS